MPKVLWVALPLLLALALLAALAWRGRAPSRRAVNIVSQLPVFDWHYLFGYGTLLLLGLHLVFNLPLGWRFFIRRHVVPAAGVRSRRRQLLAAWGGGALASVGTFVLG